MLLKNGSKGEDVKKLQEKLGVEAIGTFGPNTEAAVNEWQKANGLKDDGVVGDATWSKLFGESTPAATVIKEDVVIPSGGSLNIEKLKGHIPDAVLLQIPETAKKFNITNIKLKQKMFLGPLNGQFKEIIVRSIHNSLKQNVDEALPGVQSCIAFKVVNPKRWKSDNFLAGRILNSV